MTSGPDTEAHLSIGEVLALIQEEFPDVTISKIRFLESQGLIQPDRTASGYRKFYRADIERLQWILRQQRDHFLPLKVIRKMLDEGVDRFDPGGGEQPTLWTPTEDGAQDEDAAGDGDEPAMVGAGPGPATPRSSAHPAVASAGQGRARAGGPSRRPEPAATAQPGPTAAAAPGGSGSGSDAPPEPPAAPTATEDEPARPVHETPADVVAALQEDPRRDAGRGTPPEPPARPPRKRKRPARQGTEEAAVEHTGAELCQTTGIDEALLEGLVRFGLVEGQVQAGETVYGADAVAVARLAARYAELGVEPRHLRMYLVSAEREAGFVEQLAVPLLKQRNPQARTHAADLVDELAAMGAELHGALLRRELGPDLGS